MFYVTSPHSTTADLTIEIPPVANYDMVPGSDYTSHIDTTKATSNNNGVQRPCTPGIYRTSLEAYTGATLKERSYEDFVVEPRPEQGAKVDPLVTTVGVATVMSFTFNPGTSLGDAVASD